MFDGECGLCSFWVDFVLARDVHARFRFTPLQSPAARLILERTGLPGDVMDSICLYEDGVVYQRSTAVLKILGGLPAPWPLATVLLAVPAVLRDALYDMVARHRYAWFGKTTSCRLPTAAERARFI